MRPAQNHKREPIQEPIQEFCLTLFTMLHAWEEDMDNEWVVRITCTHITVNLTRWYRIGGIHVRRGLRIIRTEINSMRSVLEHSREVADTMCELLELSELTESAKPAAPVRRSHKVVGELRELGEVTGICGSDARDLILTWAERYVARRKGKGKGNI